MVQGQDSGLSFLYNSLTHIFLVIWMNQFPVLGVSGVLVHIYLFSIEIPVSTANSVDPAFCGVWSGFALFA